jgi:Ca2+-binding EF-hand superfamily protein
MSARKKALVLVRQHVMFFHEADKNGELEIDYNEFVEELPDDVKAHSKETLQAWFNLADRANAGKVSMAAFVEWSATMAELVTGVDLLSGLDESRFTKVAIAMGFGDYTSELYKAISLNRNGEIGGVLGDNERLNATELRSMRAFLSAMNWDSTSDTESSNVDTTGWTFTGTDVESARLSLKALFREQGVKVSQIFEKIDESDDNVLSKDEFLEGLLGPLGFAGDPSILTDCFLDVDDDGDGVVTYGEMHSWVRGRASSKKARLALARTLQLPRAEPGDVWDADRLRHELSAVLEEAGVKPIDLLSGWDEDSSGHLRKKEWLVHLKRMCADNPPEVWYSQLRNAVTDAFDEIDGGGEGTLSVSEIERWLTASESPPPSPNASPARSSPPKSPRREVRTSPKWTLLDSLERQSNRSNERTMRAVELSRELRAQMNGFKQSSLRNLTAEWRVHR